MHNFLTSHFLQIQKDTMSQQGKSTVQSIEKKLLAIPILFIVLRIWSFLLVLITLYTELRSCGIVLFLLGMGVSYSYYNNIIVLCIFVRGGGGGGGRPFVWWGGSGPTIILVQDIV